MPIDPVLVELLERITESGVSAEDACRDRPEWLGTVRACLRQLSSVRDEMDALFPADGDGCGPASRRHVGPEIAGYALGEVVGRGGMGIVFKARHLRLDRTVAVKMMLNGGFAGPSELARFRREAQALAALQHPHIVQVHDVGEADGQPYFAMEYVDGGDLARKLGGVPQPARDAAALTVLLADAVEAAHRGGIVHRDLKPSNVLLTAGGTPKVTDFGLARRLDAAAGLSLTGARVGTPGYMAPEQVAGHARVSGAATDVYSLGAILYEMLTGRPPFRAESTAETERQVLAEEPAPASGLNSKVPRDLETICLKCLQKDPKRRYPAARDLGEDLGRFLRGEPIQARPVGPAERAGKWIRRHPARAVTSFGGLALAAALLAGGWWALSERWTLARAVEDDLRVATRSLRRSDWGAGRSALERARGRLGPGGGELRRRLDQADGELNLALLLEAIRLDRIRFEEGGPAHWISLYEAAFRSSAIFEEGDSPEVAARRIKATSIEAALVAALDEWALDVTYLLNSSSSARSADVTREAWLLEVARAVDPDPSGWRDRFRDAATRKSKQLLAQLAESAELATTPANLLAALGSLIDSRGGDAIPFLTRVQRRHPGDLWVNFHLGYLHYSRGDRAEAVRYFQAALAIRPRTTTILHFHAQALKAIGRPEEATFYLENAVQVAPDDPIAILELSRYRLETGAVVGAIAMLRRGLALRPDDASLVRQYETMLRDGLMRLGRQEEAREVWARILAADPPEHGSWDGYAELCLFLGHEDQYREACRLLLRRFGTPRDAQVAERTGRACLLLPDPGEPLDGTTALIDFALDDRNPKPDWAGPYILVAKGLAEYRHGRFESAISIMNGPASTTLQPAPRLVAAMALHRLDRQEEALKTFAEAIRTGDWERSHATDRERWIYHILRREAEAMLLPGVPPALGVRDRPPSE